MSVNFSFSLIFCDNSACSRETVSGFELDLSIGVS